MFPITSQTKELDEETFVHDPLTLYGVRNGTLFLIDATPPMFENDPEEDIPYFLQCIKQYKEIIKQKLAWNSQDWIGLMLFGTEKWDMDPEVKNVLTLQKLNILSVQKMKEIMEIENGKWKVYREMASSTSYPLHDALWHAAQTFSAIKLSMPVKKVILFTCQDNPPMTDQNERHRIRVKATDYNVIHLHLSVIGLGKDWNHEIFYKDLEMLSQEIDAEDYKRTSLEDLAEQVKMPSKIAANLPFRLGNNVTLDVCLRNYTVPTEYLHWATISKERNVPLVKYTYRETVKDDTMEEDEENANGATSPILEMDVKKYQEYGNRKICFSLEEAKQMGVQREAGIDLICARPLWYHPIHHSKAPYFMTHHKSYRKDNKLLFAALVDRCMAKNIMLICILTLREYSTSQLYCMIPNANSGGFYFYNIPFADNIRSNSHLEKFKYNNENNPPPTDPEQVELMSKIIKKMEIEYNPGQFSNPKLQVERQTIEALALDLEQPEPPIDSTLPDTDALEEAAGPLFDAYEETVQNRTEQEDTETETAGRSKKQLKLSNEYDADSIRKVIQEGKMANFTVAQLKEIAKLYSLKPKGVKDELIKQIKEYFSM